MFLRSSKQLKGHRPLEDSKKLARDFHLKQSDFFAIVDTPIHPKMQGRVQFQGSWWPALCEQNSTFSTGEKVRVVGRRNITLIVDSLH